MQVVLESGKDTNNLKNASKMASGKAVSANFGGPYLETPAADRDVRGRFPAYLEVDKKLRYFFPRSLHAIISPNIEFLLDLIKP